MKKLIPIILALASMSSLAEITQEQQEKHCALFAYKVRSSFLIRKVDPRMTEDILLQSLGSGIKEKIDAGKISKEEGGKEYLSYSEPIQMAFTFDRSDDPDKVMTKTYDMCLNARKTKPML